MAGSSSRCFSQVGDQSISVWGKSKMDAKRQNLWALLVNLHLCPLLSPHISSRSVLPQDSDPYALHLPGASSCVKYSQEIQKWEGRGVSSSLFVCSSATLWQWIHFVFYTWSSSPWWQLSQCLGNTFFLLTLFPGQVLWETNSDPLPLGGFLGSAPGVTTWDGKERDTGLGRVGWDGSAVSCFDLGQMG